ncbi:MAG: DUF1997 domain-containing protein [Synechococcus sp.]|jgi:hypothetical protein|nr:DUF1997 domain-containing protein [Synechococcus sp.]
MRLEQQRLCRVVLEPAPSATQLEAFLAKPLRPLRGLLDPGRLESSGPDLFTYASRPYGVAGWVLQPRVALRVQLHRGELVLEQLACRVDGLGDWQDRLQFGLEARLSCDPGAALAPTAAATLKAQALVWAEVPGAIAIAAAPVVNLALQQLLDRLERRCHRGLRRRAEAWLGRAT